MRSARRTYRAFQASDGRIKLARLFSVSGIVAIVALLVGMLPAFGTDENPSPSPVSFGGGSGACSAEVGGLPSAASEEAHTPNPVDGATITGSDETEFTLTVLPDQTFNFEMTDPASPGLVVYDVVVNGGPKNLHYDYDGAGLRDVISDEGLHAPEKGGSGTFYNLSHINICYGEPGLIIFTCDTPVTLTDDGFFTEATVEIFGNSLNDCATKRAIFLIDNDDPPNVRLEFTGGGEPIVAGRADFTKVFANPADFVELQYSETGLIADAVDLSWCAIREFDNDGGATGPDGDEFVDFLGLNDYPSLVGVMDSDGEGGFVQATACKVAEIEYANGTQWTIVYFEFVDPHFF